MKHIKNILFLFLLLSPVASFAQVTVSAEIDSVHILIGNQAKLRLTAVQPNSAFVQFPFFDEIIPNGVEIVTRKNPDTLNLGNDRLEIRRDYVVAVFDSGVYYMPPFRFVVQDDTLLTNSLTLKAFTVPVDTVDIAFYDIKPNMRAPFNLWFYLKKLAWYPPIVLLLALIVFVIIRLVNRKPIPFISKPKPVLPPHVVALGELDKIKNEKLWQQGREKEFHTQVTDVLRNYIERRFDINAMEMTSDEILDYLSDNKEAEPVYNNLKQILKSADLVKFAKMKYLPNENEQSITDSYLFINETTPKSLERDLQNNDESKKLKY